MNTRDANGACMQWFALQVRPRYEKAISTVLRHKDYEEFLPLQRVRRRWSDRVAQIEMPLFPGYLFCRFDVRKRRLPVITTPGVLRIVGVAGMPTPVDSQEIAAIRTIVDSGLEAQPWPYLEAGNRIRIEYGALAGMEGILIEIKKQHRLVVSVTLLQRSVAVELERDWVSRCQATGCDAMRRRS